MAALLGLFGALLFRCLFAPGAASLLVRRWSLLSLAVALVATLVWFGMTVASIGDTDTIAETLALLWPVAWETQFGHVWLARFALLLGSAGLLSRADRRPWAATGVTGLALALQAGMGHAGAMGGTAGAGMMGSEVLHVLAAGAWLGGLVPLLLVLRAGRPGEAAAAARRFSPLGLSCVLVLAGTAVLQSWALIGGPVAFFQTAYGRAASVKIALFVSLLGLAGVNRLVLTDALERDGVEAARSLRAMRATVAAETALGLLVVLAAGVLASLPPAMHEQPAGEAHGQSH
jgi:copper resistance protein D